MSDRKQTDLAPGKGAPVIPHSDPAGGTGSLEAAIDAGKKSGQTFSEGAGPGLVTGASDDDPSGIGTYAVAGAFSGFHYALDCSVHVAIDGFGTTHLRANWNGLVAWAWRRCCDGTMRETCSISP